MLAVKVNGHDYDLTRPVGEDATIQFFKWEDEEGKHAFWHSSAHLLAEALQELFPGVKFGIGPAVESGFYYDIDPGDNKITEADFKRSEEKMLELARRKEDIVRREISKADALEAFGNRGETYKCELISELEDGTITTELISTADVSDAAVAATAATWIKEVDEMLGEQIAVTDINFYISDPATGKRRIRSGETNLGDFVADGIYTYFNEIEELHCDVAIMNGGGIRTDVEAGPWSFKTCKTVSPFGNVACLMSVTGQQIQDALEFGARFAGAEGKENGGFLQVAGARYTIHPMIPNTVQTLSLIHI